MKAMARKLRREAKSHEGMASALMKKAAVILKDAARGTSDFDSTDAFMMDVRDLMSLAYVNLGTARGLNNAATDLEES